MSRKTSRVLRLLELLEASGTRTRRDLAAVLGVDERTVRRDIEHLRELEIPVESVRGRYGGYRLGAGLRMPPLMLTSDESLAVAWGLLRAQASPGAAPAAAQAALSKIRRVLPPDIADGLDALLRTAAIEAPAGADAPDAEVLLTVADAVAERRPLDIEYRSARSSGEHGGEHGDEHGGAVTRAVEPIDLIGSAGRWYLVARDVAASAERTFRVDRIRSAHRTPGTLDPVERPGSARAVAEMLDGFARSPRRWRVTLRVRADEAAIRARFPTSIAVITAPPAAEPGWHLVEIQAERLDWLPSMIAALDRPVRIDAPAELRELVADAAERLSEAARG